MGKVVRIRRLIADPELTVSVVESVAIRSRCYRNAGWLSAAMAPLAVVVEGRGGLRVMDMEGKPLGRERLAELAEAAGFGKRLFSSRDDDLRMDR